VLQCNVARSHVVSQFVARSNVVVDERHAPLVASCVPVIVLREMVINDFWERFL
jgi:hypothetical protein